ncbi:MAG: hypothetical protein AAGF46_06170 [Pseudomonadota bacterium]
MTEERDPRLEELFAAATVEHDGEEFTQRLLQTLQRRKQRLLIIRLSFLVALVLLEVLLESPLQQSLGIVADGLATPLLAFQGEWMNFIAGPVNSVAGLLGLLLIALSFLYRKMVH